MFAGSIEAQVAIVRTEPPIVKPIVSLVEQQLLETNYHDTCHRSV